MSHLKRVCTLVLCTGILLLGMLSAKGLAAGGDLYVGWAAADITPPKPVALVGQLHKRLSQSVHDPLTATALGDVALATNPFELYLDYGVRMKTRSKAVLTMVVNISGAMCGYLPTAKAVRGGGYSADNYLVGPEGGQVLVNETVKQINRMFE